MRGKGRGSPKAGQSEHNSTHVSPCVGGRSDKSREMTPRDSMIFLFGPLVKKVCGTEPLSGRCLSRKK